MDKDNKLMLEALDSKFTKPVNMSDSIKTQLGQAHGIIKGLIETLDKTSTQQTPYNEMAITHLVNLEEDLKELSVMLKDRMLNKSENAENAPHGYPGGVTAIQNVLINQLKKHGFTLTKILHADKERDKYPTVFMMRSRGPMHNVVEIGGMGEINGEPYQDYLNGLKHDAEDAEGRSNAQHAAIAIALQKAGKK
jgi:hypothetical protein